jgi:hypothetical protein
MKSMVQAVLLLNEDRSNESKVFFASLARKTLEATILLPTMIVIGRIHTKASGDIPTFLSLETGTFFPVTGTTVRCGDRFETTRQCPVVLIHKDRIATITAASS